MLRVALIFFCVFSHQAFANNKCESVVTGYETSDLMYVVCDDLSELTQAQANQKLKTIFGQYVGPPDEILVYFVSSLKLVGKSDSELKPEELVGVYYTHDSILIVWPNIKSRKKEVSIEWL